jgi:A118 family predicted phage portal protein
VPLPSGSIPWPPKQLAPITSKQRELDAWYVGDAHELHSFYRQGDRQPFDRVSQHRGGVAGALARMWWGRPARDLTKIDDDKLHVPLPTDLCQASADLLYAEPPSFASSDATGQKELDRAVEDGLVTVLAEGAEVGAALGDAYYRVTWDRAFADRSFITTVHADAAWPEFRWGRLVAVTFWWVVQSDDTTVVRHLERHELDGQGNGVTFHGLYEGTKDNLGRLVPLTEHPSTAGITVDADAALVEDRTRGLAVAHVPNQRPQRQWRTHPIGAHLGRSDLAGLEPHFDKLDMVYSSWMRDIRLAKARLIVPAYMLESAGPGRGVWFDTDQDIFTTLNAPPREDGKSEITPQQFDIRVEQHKATAEQLVQNILRTAGYSQQTFGEGDDGAAMTATEVTSKDRRSNLTRDRKIRAAQPALVALLRKKLAVDAAVFSTGVSDVDVAVEFVDTTQADAESLARTSETLYRAQAASAVTRVKIAHPDWDEKAIEDEASAILSEFGAQVPDPFSFRPGVDDQSGSGVADVGSDGAGQS